MMIRTQLLLPQDMLFGLRKISSEEGMSVSELARSIFSKVIAKKEKKKMTGVEGLEYLLKHAFKGPGPRDLSTNDDYLYGPDVL